MDSRTRETSRTTSIHSPNAAVGTPQQVVAKLAERRELGLDYVISYFPEAAYDRSGLELWASEVIPALQ